MIEYKTGNIFSENVEALVNTVNCVGVMGRGLALQFKKTFPDNFKAYKIACAHNEIQPGKLFVFNTGNLVNPHYIINFPTKRHWRGASNIRDIELGLFALKDEIKSKNICSIAMPPIGCGLGGLDWGKVKALIEQTFIDHPSLKVVVYQPNENIVLPLGKAPIMTPGRAALVSLMDRYLKGLMDPFISLLELHKLMYFMQEAGEDLRLDFKKALYGPYAENLRHVLHSIEGHMISGYGDGGDDPSKELSLIPNAIEESSHYLEGHQKTIDSFNRVVALVDGFETSFGLELLATVHWVVVKEEATSKEDLLNRIYNWNKRKKQFTERQILLALERLKQNNWIDKVWP